MVVIGAGRIGLALRDAAHGVGLPCTLVSRTEGWDALDGPQGDPILLAVRNDDLAGIIARVPTHRRNDLVFMQNGALRTLLKEQGLHSPTRGLLYFAVAKRGDPISHGRTSWFTGPHGLAVARWMNQLGVDAEDVPWPRFSMFEMEKLCWLAVFGPLCELHDATVGDVSLHHRDDVNRLTDELRAICRAAMNVDVPLDWLTDRLCDYSASIADYRASVKEWPWRNGWLVDAAKARGVDNAFHHEIMREIGKGDLLES